MSGKKKRQNALTDIQHILYIHILYIHIQPVRTRKVPTCCLFKSFSLIIFFRKDKIDILKRFAGNNCTEAASDRI